MFNLFDVFCLCVVVALCCSWSMQSAWECAFSVLLASSCSVLQSSIDGYVSFAFPCTISFLLGDGRTAVVGVVLDVRFWSVEEKKGLLALFQGAFFADGACWPRR